MNKLLFYLERKIAAFLMRQLKKSLKYEVIDQPHDELKCIYMFWHRNLLLLCLQRLGDPITVLISPSKDGELIAGPVSELGYKTIRGSSSRDGFRALKEMIREAKEQQLAITPDGPKGPIGTINPGVFQIAYFAGIPIVPVAADSNREWVFNSWDRFRVPKPFARIRVIYGEPVYIRDRTDFATHTARLKAEMTKLEKELSQTGNDKKFLTK